MYDKIEILNEGRKKMKLENVYAATLDWCCFFLVSIKKVHFYIVSGPFLGMFCFIPQLCIYTLILFYHI